VSRTEIAGSREIRRLYATRVETVAIAERLHGLGANLRRIMYGGGRLTAAPLDPANGPVKTAWACGIEGRPSCCAPC
jgi:hypothetical protein